MKKIILFIAISMVFGLAANAQSASTIFFNSGNSNLPVVGTNFDVPIDVNGFDAASMPLGITAITIYFEFDDSVIDYTGFTNSIAGLDYGVNENTPGILTVEVYDWINLWYNVADGKLLDLQFDYLGGYTAIEFDAQSEYGDENFIAIPIPILNNGFVGDFIIDGGDWNTPGDWTTNVVPPAGAHAIVAAGTETTIGAAAMCNNLTIEQGGELTSNSTLDVGGDFLIESDAVGSGSFIDNGTLTVTGTTSAECYVTNDQWHGIASPVSGETFAAMYLGGSPEVWVQDFDEASGTYSDISDITTLMGDMYGWFTYVQTGAAPQTFTFEGAFRTGTVGSTDNMAHNGLGHNYVGNAFTSAIDWDAAAGWTKTNLYNAIYVYNSGNWAAYVGGVGVFDGSQYIAMSQGFFVQVDLTGPGTLTMDNQVCVHNPVPYLKATNAEQQIVRLQLEDGGLVDEAVVRFTDDATHGFDGDFDASKFFSFNADYPQIYSTANNFMAINSLPFVEWVKIQMDVRGKDGNSMTITATEFADFDRVFLKDNFTGVTTDLSSDAYTFTYDADVTSRFTLLFSITDLDEGSLMADAVNIFAADKYIHVVLDQQVNADITVYNLMGQEIATRSANSTVTRIPVAKTGYYLVKVSDGKQYSTQKVFIK